MRGGALERHRRDWEQLAEVDPLWAILAAPDARGGRWKLDEFFATGEAEIAEVLDVSAKTVARDWSFAKVWLVRQLSDAA